MPRFSLLALLVVLAMGCATAQPTTDSPATSAPAHDYTALTDAERAVQAQIAQDGLHVVHFWAPWCDNSISELQNGWYEVVEQNPDVTFTFVTVWSDNATGEDVLTQYAIPERVVRLTLPDFGPSGDKPNRRKQFLGLPFTWIPTTWVFHKNGQLAYAFNWGELEMPQLQQALDGARNAWSHD
ncbi:MAG TPA: thioredoxin [Rubricoccaceae bacterium]|nr:thioredoxin [Rubricoccaceae bacterium]